MPLLSEVDARRLLDDARTHRSWGVHCQHHCAQDYCRSCDEFYWIHPHDCSLRGPKHDGHRLTIVPFVEVR